MRAKRDRLSELVGFIVAQGEGDELIVMVPAALKQGIIPPEFEGSKVRCFIAPTAVA
jgi:hypothetical protein